MFKTFPEFSKLTLDDKGEYEALIKGFPPIHDISFPGLMAWWDVLDSMRIALLNENLIIPYWLPGDERHSGLSLIGTNDVDQSICAIFDHLREKGEPQRLVNVPEFVISSVEFPAMFTFKEDRFYHEYILPISNFYPLKNMTKYRRNKVERQMARAGENNVVTKSLDLNSRRNKDTLWYSTLKWQAKGINNYGKAEQEAMKICIYQAEALGLENVCLFVSGELYGFCMYHIPHDKRFVNIKHIKATHVSTIGFELIAHMFARWFAEQDILYVNVNADLGLLRLRMFMLTLGPVNFFRKYCVEPA